MTSKRQSPPRGPAGRHAGAIASETALRHFAAIDCELATRGLVAAEAKAALDCHEDTVVRYLFRLMMLGQDARPDERQRWRYADPAQALFTPHGYRVLLGADRAEELAAPGAEGPP